MSERGTERAPRPAYLVLKRVAESGDPESGETYAVLPRSEWRCALDL